MSNTGHPTSYLLGGLGIGVGFALLFAPQSGEKTREWIADTAEREIKTLSRSGRRSMREVHHAIIKGEKKFAYMLKKGGKEALALVASILV